MTSKFKKEMLSCRRKAPQEEKSKKRTTWKN